LEARSRRHAKENRLDWLYAAPYNPKGPVSQADQVLWFDAVPLLAVAAAYLGATARLSRERKRLEPQLWVFPVVAVAAAVYGALLAVDHDTPPGGVWPTLADAALLAVPAALVLGRRAAPARASVAGRDLESIAAIATAFTGTDDAPAIARELLERVEPLVSVELACLFLVDEEARFASGVIGRLRGNELDWFPDARIDLEQEPSGVATATYEAAPFAVYDAPASDTLNARLVEATGAKSAAFIPLLANRQVLGVLVVGTTTSPRAFSTEELTLLQTVAGEAALALSRTRSTAALDDALERERFVARISARVRSELDVDELLRVAVRETGVALGVNRCFIRLGDTENAIPIAAQWHADGLTPLESGVRLAASNLAVRRRETVAVGDVAAAAELDDESLGGIEALVELGSRSVLAVPIVVFGELIGVLALHRAERREWTPDEVALTEAVAREIGLAIHVARLVRENERRLAQQTAFFRIAAMVGESLSLSATLDALAQVASDAFGGDAAAVAMPRGAELELASSFGLPDSLTAALALGIPASAESLESAAADARVLASPDLSADDRFDHEWQSLIAEAGYRALLAVPVQSPRAQRFGLVLVLFARERLFTDEDVEVARNLSDAARGALERSELFEAERTARALSQQLARTGSVLATELDPAAVLDEVVQQAPALLAADACAVRTLEDDELVVSAAVGAGADDALGSRASASAWLSGDVFQSRAPLAVEDVAADARLATADPIVLAGYRAYLGVPLGGSERTPAGVLAVYARRPRVWRAEEIEALQALAGNTSAALANAELYSRVSLEKERSVAILANIADGIVAVDRDGSVVLWNAAAEEITGVPQEEAIGRTPAQVLQRQLSSEEEQVPGGQRLVSIPRGAEEVWLSLSEAVMRDPLGAVAGRIFAFRDISADRMVEQVKSDFVAAVSHELRTPLTSIYGFAETLLRQDIPFGEEDRRTFLGYIASESERLTEIVDQLLNVARLDAGDLHVQLDRIDVGSVVSEVVGTAEGSDGLNGHRFEIDLPDEPLAAQADPEKVRQVFNILVENALRYSPAGGTVTVGARRNADRVEVRVVDQGMGIPASEREWIFRKFYRAESAARDGAAGTGLGLFIAKELVNAMGGRIWVDSTEGQGSSFAFELPAARE
jgi:PAS domain S-box-containing protein